MVAFISVYSNITFCSIFKDLVASNQKGQAVIEFVTFDSVALTEAQLRAQFVELLPASELQQKVQVEEGVGEV